MVTNLLGWSVLRLSGPNPVHGLICAAHGGVYVYTNQEYYTHKNKYLNENPIVLLPWHSGELQLFVGVIVYMYVLYACPRRTKNH